ncbi:MAG: M48 family metalloprotease [Candidatus Aminicenantes bacterium]|nr:M48 family metalloprotease [Candidatus Aminicenantes bacterium]
MKKNRVFILILIIIYPLLYSSNLYGHNKDYIEWWIANHGDYTKTTGKDDRRVGWARHVFDRVKNAADKAAARPPRFFIIKSSGERKPLAMAIPDGSIIINSSTLKTCYRGAAPPTYEGPGNFKPDKVKPKVCSISKKKGDARLAFILGHELAHLGNKDFIHREAFLALEKYGDDITRQELGRYMKNSPGKKEARENKTRELLADSKGVLYAAMAGYDSGSFFGKKDDFLRSWVEQAGVGNFYDDDPRHPAMRKRVRFVRTQLQSVVEKTELFRAGVLLYQRSSFRDSLSAFREFAKVYPAREVLNNTGACYLSLALRHLHLKYSEDYYRFRLSTAIDYSTTAKALTFRNEGDYLKSKEFSRYIERAEDYFKQAAGRDNFDRTCRYNLSAALILKKEYSAALAVCEKLLKEDPRDAKALNNKAIAFHYYGREEDLETTQKAIQILRQALKLDPGNFEALYNLAALKQERERLAGARRCWEDYLQLAAVPRDNFYDFIYKKLKGVSPPALKHSVAPPPVPGGIKLGEDFSNVEKKWGKEHINKFKLGIEEKGDKGSWYLSLQVIVKGKVRVLALDGMVELVEQEVAPARHIEKDLEKYGPPRKIVRHSGGFFYIYKDRGFSIKEIGGRVSAYIYFEKDF